MTCPGCGDLIPVNEYTAYRKCEDCWVAVFIHDHRLKKTHANRIKTKETADGILRLLQTAGRSGPAVTEEVYRVLGAEG
jgi:hypothetical protein